MPRQPNNHENNEGTPPRSIHIPISKDTELHKTNDARTPPDSTIETENTGANPQPFFQPNQQNMNMRPQRYPNPANPQSMIYQPPQMIYAMGHQGQYHGQQQIIMNTNMIPQQRMQTQLNPGIPSSQPPSTQGQVQQQYPKPKEKKHILNIVDPNTGKNITADILKSQSGTEVTTVSQDSGFRSTPVSTTEETSVQSGEQNVIAAQFAALVAAKLFTPDGTSPSNSQAPLPSHQQAQGLQRQPSNQENKSRLHKANVARKPSHKDSEKEPEEDDATIEELYRKTRSILDKLTPQTFQTLVSQMRSLPIDSESKLKCVIDLVFEKAISEHNLVPSATYANMCRYLSMFKVPSEKKPGEMVNFRAVILTRCQREFEKYISPKTMFVTKGGERELTKDEEAERKVAVLQQGPENEKSKARYVGNIRFMGELFKLKMLTENIMHDCVFKLLRTKDPDNLECLCHLLTTIGKELDTDKAKIFIKPVARVLYYLFSLHICPDRIISNILDQNSEPRMDQYFQHMGKIVNQKMTSSRVCLMLQDVMDLRTNRWVPRRVDNNPKAIDQTHKEVAEKAQGKALLSQQKQPQQRTQRGGRQTCSAGQMGDGGFDGWKTVGAIRTPLKSVDVPVDPFKIKLSKQNVDSVGTSGGGAGRFSGSTGGTTESPFQEKEKPNRAIVATSTDDGGHSGRSQGHAETECQPSPVQPASVELKVLSEAEMEKTKAVHDELFATRDVTQNVDESNIQLGPGGGAGRFSGWGRGSTGGTTGRPSQEKEKPNTPANRFYALSRPDEEQGRRFGGVSPARSEGRGHGFGGRPPSLGARRSQESDWERAVAAAKAICASQSIDGGHIERSRGRAEPERQPSPVHPASVELKVLSEAEMEKKTKDILDEYFAIQNIREAILCVQELSTQNHHHFVYHALNHVLERSSQARKQTGHILQDLVNRKIISVDNYIKGLVEVLEYAEDLEIDIPKIWQYYGELISPMIQDNCVPLSFLKEAVKPLLANDKAGILLAEILNDASQRVDYFHTLSYEQHHKDVPSGVSGREYTNGGDSAPTTPTTGLPVKEIEVKLDELVVQDKADNKTVFDWIESNIDDPTTKRPMFIRALMTAVCNSAIKGDKGKERLEPKEISTRNDLLQKYLDHQAESELQALFALQALVTKLQHPNGLLRGMFDTLYDEDLISEDVFFQWEKSEDEPEGKNVCLKQTIIFFTWLREAVEDS